MDSFDKFSKAVKRELGSGWVCSEDNGRWEARKGSMTIGKGTSEGSYYVSTAYKEMYGHDLEHCIEIVKTIGG